MRVPVLDKYIQTDQAFVERRLPGQGNLYVKKGDRVNSFDQLGQSSFVKDGERIEFTGVPTKEIGDRVYPGDVVAVEKKLIVTKKDYTTTISGRIKEINLEKKYIEIEGLSRVFNLISGVSGEVVDTLNNQSVLIKTQALIIKCAAGTGEEVAGELLYLQSKEPVITEKEITEKVAGKIVIANKIESGALKKAQTLNAQGFVVGSCDYIEYKKYIEEKLNVLLVEGFGNLNINPDLIKYFESLQSKFGILRTYDTMLLIPGEHSAKIGNSAVTEKFLADVKVGDTLQIFSAQHYAHVAQVKKINEEKNTLTFSIEDKDVEVDSRKVGLIC